MPDSKSNIPGRKHIRHRQRKLMSDILVSQEENKTYMICIYSMGAVVPLLECQSQEDVIKFLDLIGELK